MNHRLELLFLKLRNEIASKEFEICQANRDLDIGGWRYAHDEVVRQCDGAIEYMTKEIEQAIQEQNKKDQ